MNKKYSILIAATLILLFSAPVWGATYTVTNCADSGAGSLRQALIDANAAGSGDIVFDITTIEAGYSTGEAYSGLVTNESGSNAWFRIIIYSKLTIEADNIAVQGWTQTWEAANTSGPSVEVRAYGSEDNFEVTGNYTTIEGLVLNRAGPGNSSAGIYLNGATNCHIYGSYTGMNATGDANLNYRNMQGFRLNAASYNVIGGSSAAERNLISGNNQYGIQILNSSNSNEVYGNFFGTQTNGITALNNNRDIYILDSLYNQIGSSESSRRNIMAGSNQVDRCAILIESSPQNCVEGNFIGLGTNEAVFTNYRGIDLRASSSGNRIISNVISGNSQYGIYLTGGNTTSNEVVGNFIGVNSSGTSARANVVGIRIEAGAKYNRIGNGSPAGKNIISGNSQQGIVIEGSGTDNNEILGNYIGTDASGTSEIKNTNGGIAISSSAQFNLVGDGTAGGKNIIAHDNSSGWGITISGSGTNSNEVLGNYIGTDVNGTTDLGFSRGVMIQDQAKYNRVGNGTAGGRNIIAGCNTNGIQINGSGTDYNEILGNWVGLQSDGVTPLANSGGVLLYPDCQFNRVGSPGAAVRNIVSGNTNYGIKIQQANNNYIEGNWVGLGTDESRQGNNNGLELIGTSCFNHVNSNVISGNTNHGIYINGAGTNSNEVYANYIGVDPAGTAELSNEADGINISSNARYNRIGNGTFSGRNVISGNNDAGIEISGSFYNKIKGNIIGLDKNGTNIISNNFGVTLFNSDQNVFGGTTFPEKNYISGNVNDGIYMSNAEGNQIYGNYIGFGFDGETPLTNRRYGIYVRADTVSQNNLIGTSESGGGNLILASSEGTTVGIFFTTANTVSNFIYNNIIGLTSSESVPANQGKYGVEMGGSANTNYIGGTGANEGNIISGNSSYGIAISGSGTNNNEILENYIGTDSSGLLDRGNNYGIYIFNNASFNTVGPNNTIAYSGIDGIRVDGSNTTQEVITQNSSYSNSGKGIALTNGANPTTSTPEVIFAGYNEVTELTLVTGESAPALGTVEVFKAEGDEGKDYLGSTLADGSGNWSITVSGLATGDAVVATGTTANPETSEFSSTEVVVTGVSKQYQPDNMIATLEAGTDYVGEGIFNLDGTNQTRSQSIVTGQPATYYIKIKNSGNTTDEIEVVGPASSGSWTLTYYDAKTGGTDITSQITGAGWSTGVLVSAETKEIRMIVAGSGTAVATLEALVTSESKTDNVKEDAVKAATTFIPTELSHFDVSAPSSAVANNPFSMTVIARKPSGATEEVIIGTTSLSVDDGLITPESIAPSGFVSGIWTGNVTLSKPGTRSVTVANGSALGTAEIIVTNASKEFTSGDLGIPGMSITVPAGAALSDVSITATEISDPPGNPPAGFKIGGKIINIVATPSEFLEPVTVTIPIDGPLKDPQVYYWDGTKWSKDGITIVSSTDTSLTFTTTHFTVFAPMAAIPGNLVRFGPNPYNPNSGTDARIWYWLDADTKTSIYIVDMAGTLVWKENYASGDIGGRSGANSIAFDGKDQWGNVLGDGVYIYKIVQGGKVVGGGKIAIIK